MSSCGNCRFFRVDLVSRNPGETLTYGACHRRAPASNCGLWPETRSEFWCGEHEPVAGPSSRPTPGPTRAQLIEEALVQIVRPYQGLEIRDLRPEIARAFTVLRMPKEPR